MSHPRSVNAPRTAPSIWWWAFGYFACYVPYAALTKILSKGYVDTGGTPVDSRNTRSGGPQIPDTPP